MTKVVLTILIIILFSANAYSAREPDSLAIVTETNQPFFYTQYDKQLVTHLFTNKLIYKDSFNGLDISAKNVFTSTITEVSSKFIKYEEETDVSGEYLVSSLFIPGITITRVAQNDNRSVELNSSSLNRYTFHLGLRPAGNLYIRSFAGYSGHKQLNEQNTGIYYGTEALLPETFFENTRSEGLILFTNEDIMPRRNLNRVVRLSIVNLFPEAIVMGLSADYSTQRRDFYLNADPALQSLFGITRNIQTRNEIKSELRGFIRSGDLFQNLQAEGMFRLQYRTVDRDSRYKPVVFSSSSGLGSELNAFRFEGSGSAVLNIYPLLIRLRGSISQQEEKNTLRNEPSVDEFLLQQFNQKEQEKNFSASRMSLSTSFQWFRSAEDFIQFDLSQQKLTYDTPAPLNYDDRDELMSIMRISYEHRSVREFNWSVGAEGYLSRNVYLFAQRSANNSINRFLKYFAGNFLQFPWLTSRNYAEVSALYTVYDYEDLLPNYRSLSFRQFLFTDSTNIPLKGAFSVQTEMSIKFAEQGLLYWDEFSTLPERYVTEFQIAPKLGYAYFDLRIYAGYRYLTISLYRYDKGVKSLSDEYRSSGPVVSVHYSRGERYLASFSLYQEYQSNNSSQGRQNSNINMTVQWFF